MKADLLENEYLCIQKQEYIQLIDLETRVNVLVDLIASDRCVTDESILRILGTELAIITANEMKEKREKCRNEINKNVP